MTIYRFSTYLIELRKIRSITRKKRGTKKERVVSLSNSKFISKYAVCPFYHRHEPNRICCEGVSDENTLNLVFTDTKKLKAYTTVFCNDMRGYKNCAVRKMLMNKYGGG